MKQKPLVIFVFKIDGGKRERDGETEDQLFGWVFDGVVLQGKKDGKFR